MRWVAVCLALGLLLSCGCGEGETLFDPPEIPAFTADYGASDFYDELLLEWGLFRNWSIEAKAWFSSVIPSLSAAEQQRLETHHPQWRMNLPFVPKLTMHRYGVPEQQAIDEQRALNCAREWYEVSDYQDALYTDLCVFYYVDNPLQPQWVFAFYNRQQLVVETSMDALTGRFPEITATTAISLAEEALLSQSWNAGSILIDREILKSSYVVASSFDFDRNLWCIRFQALGGTQCFEVYLEDATGKIHAIHGTNG